MTDIIMNTAAMYAMEIIKTIILTLVGIAGAWLLAQTGKSKHLGNINQALQELQGSIAAAVTNLQNTLVENWKAANEDGKLTEQEIDYLNKTLVQTAVNNLSAPALKILNAAHLDLEEYILDYGGQIIFHIKKQYPALPADIADGIMIPDPE